MPEEPNSQVADKLQQIFVNPVTRAAVASAISSPRPHGWSPKSKAPYFNRACALEIKEHIDKQIETGEDLIFRYAVWCTFHKITSRTLYSRINQGILFLCERMDEEGKYAVWYSTCNIDCRNSTLGIIIKRFKTSIGSIKPETIAPRQSLPQWRKELMDWLEGDSDDPFVKENLALSPEEIVSLREEFLPNGGLMVDIKSNKIAIVKQ